MSQKELGLKEQVRDASLKLSELHDELGEYEEAFHYQKQYIAYKDSVADLQTIQEMANLRTDFEVSQKQAEVDLAQKQEQVNRIFAFSAVGFAFLIAILAFVLFRSNQQKLRTNTLLTTQKEEIEKQRDQLQNLNKTKDRFFGIISHDLRGPVNAFQGVTQMIRTYVNKNKIDRLLLLTDKIDQSTGRLSGLLDNLLNWALTQQGTYPYVPERLSIQQLSEEIVDVFDHAAQAKNISLKINLKEDYDIWADRNSTLALLRNLVNNAIKFTEDEGQVSISATCKKDKVEVQIHDTGVGMPAEKAQSLFNLSLHNSSDGTEGEKGSGLGLVLCKEFAILNKGSITATSKLGEGTTFMIELPRFEHKEAKVIEQV